MVIGTDKGITVIVTVVLEFNIETVVKSVAETAVETVDDIVVKTAIDIKFASSHLAESS